MIGICFGHQIIAEAMGGRVMKSTKGWGIGVQEYSIQNNPGWLEYSSEGIFLGLKGFCKGLLFTRTKLLKYQMDARCSLKNDFCPYAMLAYGSLAKPKIVTLQTHPEFSSDYFKDLSLLRRNDPIPEKLVDQARKY